MRTAPPDLSDVSAAIAVTFSDAPDAAVTLRVEDGTIEMDETRRPDIEVTLTQSDAAAINAGELAPAVAYMQGRLKPSGDMALVLDLVERTSTARFRSWLAVQQ